MSVLHVAIIGRGPWGAVLARELQDFGHRVVVFPWVGRDWRGLLNDDLDGVIIATPPSSHAEIACEFLARGVGVLIEKPLALSLADCRAIQEAEHQSNLLHGREIPVLVGHTQLFNPLFRHMKSLLHRYGGVIQEAVRHMRAEWGGTGPVRDGVPGFWDYAPHPLSMALGFAGWRAPTKACLLDETDFTAEFEPGQTLYIQAGNNYRLKARRFTIYTADKAIVMDDLEHVILVQPGVLNDHEFAPAGPIQRAYLPENAPSPVQVELTAFLDALDGAPRAVCDYADYLGSGLGRSIVGILEKVSPLTTHKEQARA